MGDEYDLTRCGCLCMITDRTDDVVRRLTVDRPYSDVWPAFPELLDGLVDQFDRWLSDDELLASPCCMSGEFDGRRRLTARDRSGNPIRM